MFLPSEYTRLSCSSSAKTTVPFIGEQGLFLHTHSFPPCVTGWRGCWSFSPFSQGTADDISSISPGTSGAGAAGGAALPCAAEPSAPETPKLISSSEETGSVNALLGEDKSTNVPKGKY